MHKAQAILRTEYFLLEHLDIYIEHCWVFISKYMAEVKLRFYLEN